MSLSDYWRRVQYIQRRGTHTRNTLMLLQTLNAGVLNASARPFTKFFTAADFDFYRATLSDSDDSALSQAALTQILSEVASVRP